MLYPDDRLSARRAWEVLSQENLAMQQGHQSGYSQIGDLIQKDMRRGIFLGKLCGYVACQVRWNYENRGEAFVNKAVFTVSEYYSGDKTPAGRNIPTDGKRLRDSFSRKYKGTIHLWAAFVLLEETGVAENFLDKQQELDEFMILALDMQNFLVTTNVLSDLNLLCIPTEYEKKFANFTVNFPQEPEWVEEILAGYRDTFTR